MFLYFWYGDLSYIFLIIYNHSLFNFILIREWWSNKKLYINKDSWKYKLSSFNDSEKRILQIKIAYAIMPVGKRDCKSIWTKERTPQLYARTIEGFFLSFYSGKAPTRLFVALIVSVKPFDDEMANHTTQNSH